MKDIRRKFEYFCMKNRSKGIPSLMLYLTAGNAIVYLITTITGNYILYNLLCFHRQSILHGQVWRLISYPLTLYNNNILFMLISLFCYYSLGAAMERQWGTCKFNLFYLTGVVLMDIAGMLLDYNPTVYYLNMSLFLGFATLYPDVGFLMFFVIPIKAWVLALIDLVIVLSGVFHLPVSVSNLFPLISLANYFLFFGADVLNVIPESWKQHIAKLLHKNYSPKSKTVPFTVIRPQKTEQVKPSYTHKCTICGKTDISNPELDFRYCSRCRGYYCYCSNHINNHSHIE